MAKKIISTGAGSLKRALIDRNNSRLVIIVCATVFLVVFSLVSTRALYVQWNYQNRVIDLKKKASDQLKSNLKSIQELQPSYTSFVNTTTNVIQGNSFGAGPKDGNNAKIILSALPSIYDFPGMTTNLETIINDQGVALSSITGIDDEITQSENTGDSEPKPVEMPFQFTATTDYEQMQKIINALEKSIRPMEIRQLSVIGAQGKLTLDVSAVTYYQQGKTLELKEKVVPLKEIKK